MAVNGLEYILDGLEAELELERELGVREVEIDRSLLKGAAAEAKAGTPVSREADRPKEQAAERARAPVGASPKARDADASGSVPICFLHDSALTPPGEEMMSKIVAALRFDPSRAPVVFAPPRPQAKVVVVLGALALRKWFPGRKAEPGASFVADGGEEVLVTYSPSYILRFRTVTPAVQNIKKSMWATIKTAAGRIGDRQDA